MIVVLTRILGWLWIVGGSLFFIKPGLLKRKLQKKSIRRVKKYLCLVAIFAGFILMKVSREIRGALSKITMILGVLGVIKGFIFIKNKTSERIIEWFSKQSLSFRLISLLYIGMGIVVLIGVKRQF